MASFACPAEKQRRGWGDWEGSSELQRPHEPLEMDRGVERFHSPRWKAHWVGQTWSEGKRWLRLKYLWDSG